MDSRQLSTIIKEFQQSDKYREIVLGQKYYDGENVKIDERKKLCASSDGMPIEDPYKANHKLKNRSMKFLCKQLSSYLLGNGISYKSDQDVTDLDTTLKRFDKTAVDIANAAGKYSVAWVHPQIKNNEFKLKLMKSEQIIPIYEDEELLYIIKFYSVSRNDKKLTKVEVWDDTSVTYYIEDANGIGNYKLCGESEEPVNPAPHMTTTTKANGNVQLVKQKSWGRVPFVPLHFNSDGDSQLTAIKEWVDIWDITASDFANNIDDFQDVFWILKNYNGQNLEKYMKEVKQHKTIKVGEDGDARAETLKIPVEAREKFLEIANDAIYTFGQGVDPNKTGDGNITNVVIRNRYSLLDLKADEFQTQFEDFFENLLYFVNVYNQQSGKTQYSDVSLILERSMVINKIETMEAIAKQKGIVSDVTLLENHPLVDNVDDELKRIEEQNNMNPVTL